MKYFALLTKLGENLLAQATALGTKLELTHMAVGDGGGSLPTPDTNQTKLIAEKRRAAINTLFIDDKNKNQIIAEQIIPEQDGGWWIREIGLFDKAGNLIAVANCPETYKPQLAEGSGRTQSIRMVLIVSHTESVTLKIDPSVVLATREYVNTEITVLDKKIDALSAQTKLDLNKKFDKANISGQKGNDNDKVPSLHLFTTEIGKLAAIGYSYSKIESDGRYQLKGEYATSQALTDGLGKKFDKTGGTVNGPVTATSDVQGAQVRAKSSADSQINLNPLDTAPRIEHKTKGGSWFQHTLPDKSGTLMLVGDYGFGTSATELLYMSNEQMTEWLRSGAKLTQVVRNQAGTASAYSNSPLAYFRTHDTFMAISADYLGSGVRVIAGSSGSAFRIHTLLTNQTTTTDKNGIVRSTGTKTTLVTDDIAQNSGQSLALVMSQKATSDAIDAAKGVGVGQSWRKSDIAFGVSYTNSSSQPITIIFNGVKQSSESATVTCEINGLSIQFAKSTNSGGAVWLAGSIVIPAGSSYKFTVTSGTVGDFYTLG